jgi:hypothetical protein
MMVNAAYDIEVMRKILRSYPNLIRRAIVGEEIVAFPFSLRNGCADRKGE